MSVNPTPRQREPFELYAFRIPSALLNRVRAAVQQDSRFASVSHFIRLAIERALRDLL